MTAIGEQQTCQGKPRSMGLDSNEKCRWVRCLKKNLKVVFKEKKAEAGAQSQSTNVLGRPRHGMLCSKFPTRNCGFQGSSGKKSSSTSRNSYTLWNKYLSAYLAARSTQNECTRGWSLSYQTKGLIWRNAHLMTWGFWYRLASRRSLRMMRILCTCFLTAISKCNTDCSGLKPVSRGHSKSLNVGYTSQRRIGKPLEICR